MMLSDNMLSDNILLSADEIMLSENTMLSADNIMLSDTMLYDNIKLSDIIMYQLITYHISYFFFNTSHPWQHVIR
jgi:uncharacterized protein YacL (UPF0231 family)